MCSDTFIISLDHNKSSTINLATYHKKLMRCRRASGQSLSKVGNSGCSVQQ